MKPDREYPQFALCMSLAYLFGMVIGRYAPRVSLASPVGMVLAYGAVLLVHWWRSVRAR